MVQWPGHHTAEAAEALMAAEMRIAGDLYQDHLWSDCPRSPTPTDPPAVLPGGRFLTLS
jgi:hypothetical protein